MKYLIGFFAVFIVITTFAQNSTHAWLPEKYVHAITSNDTSGITFLRPISGFEKINKKLYILTFGGEVSPLKSKVVYINGIKKSKIINIDHYLNLKYFAKEEQSEINKMDIYFSIEKDKLLIEMCKEDTCNKVYFIDHFSGYEFKDLYKTRAHLLHLK